jgi:hypothetical protein
MEPADRDEDTADHEPAGEGGGIAQEPKNQALGTTSQKNPQYALFFPVPGKFSDWLELNLEHLAPALPGVPRSVHQLFIPPAINTVIQPAQQSAKGSLEGGSKVFNVIGLPASICCHKRPVNRSA